LLTHDLLNVLIDFLIDAFIVIYADDINNNNNNILLSKHTTLQFAILCQNLVKLQMLINKLTEWATLNGLKLNAGKT
jgi:hypothetical protein